MLSEVQCKLIEKGFIGNSSLSLFTDGADALRGFKE